MCAQHCDLVKSAEDPNTYLINDTADPLQQSLSGLLLDGLPPSASAAFAPRTGAASVNISSMICSNQARFRSAGAASHYSNRRHRFWGR